MNFQNWLNLSYPDLKPASINAVLALSGEGATIPFISRYRKEQTGNLDEVAIQVIIEGKEKFDDVIKRQLFIKEEVERQNKLTPELAAKIATTFNLEALEDIYLPYKQKRKTKAIKAKEAGLEPLAQLIWDWGQGNSKFEKNENMEALAQKFVSSDRGIADSGAALQGAQEILTEKLAEMPELRQFVREYSFKNGFLRSEKAPKAQPHSKFDKYFDSEEKVSSLLQPQNSHRYLAMRRGWVEEELKISIGSRKEDADYDKTLLGHFEQTACKVTLSPGSTYLLKAAKFALKAHVQTSIDAEVHQALKTVADEAAIKVFSENVRKLLMSAPFGSKAVLGVDPGVRTGCKIAVVNDAGKFIASTVMYTQTDGQKKQAVQMLKDVLSTQNIRAVAVGNGTAGRETETLIRDGIKTLGLCVPVIMVNESGASVYSASEAAREEFPDQDVTVRGAISIARRLQDPLAELVKIDPKSIGVGQYQHDVSPHMLKKNLDVVVDSCVNGVGVNLNTASYHLLSHVSGIGPGLAKTIVEFRGKNGVFKSRSELLEVPRFSKRAFELSAGFLRVPESKNHLDNTGVHPERYDLLQSIADEMGKKVNDFIGAGSELLKKQTALRDKLGAFTFDDIVKELEKPGRDPRESFVPFQFREDIHDVKDLKAGMICPGIVTNVTNFGAFVDIGVHQDGLVHISQLANKFVKDPREVVSPGDHVQVKVVEINTDKNQIALTMRRDSEPQVKNAGEALSAKTTNSSQAFRLSQTSRPSQVRRSSQTSSSSQVSKSPQSQKSASSGSGFANNPFAALAGKAAIVSKPTVASKPGAKK